jgi:uncharacterized protein YdcH (DUF465 family)
MEGHKTKYTPTEVIRAIEGLHRRRFYEMMNNGEIAYETQGAEGKKRRIIDASELIRVFGSTFNPEGTHGTEIGKKIKQIEHTQNNPLDTEIHVLQERLKAKDEILSQKDEMIRELREDRDTWRTQAQTLLLTDGRTGSRRGFWNRLFG